MPICCTLSARSRAPARGRAFCRTAFCSGAMQRERFRRNLVRKGYIEGIIGLPANIFYGTGIPACIIVINKQDAHARKGIFMIDASQGFMKDGPKNRLRAQDIHKIVDTFTRRLDIPGYSRMVSSGGDREERVQPQPAALHRQPAGGGHPGHRRPPAAAAFRRGMWRRLEHYWAVCPNLKAALFQETRPGYFALAVDKEAIKPTIFEHPEFVAFTAGMNAHFQRVERTQRCHAQSPASRLSPQRNDLRICPDDLLDHYADMPLIDKYDVYQHLMDYWEKSMQDDCYLIAADGWKAETYRVIEKDKKGKEKDKGWTCDLVPKALIVARYFAQEQAAIDQLAAELDSITARMAELEEEHGGEDGAFSELDKVNKANVTARLKEIKGDREAKGRSRRAE